LNALIRSNGLRNTAGPNYTPLPPVGTKTAVQPTATASQQSNVKWQAVYPGIAVSVTVEGPYQNVRHFVRDIEISREFLIVNAVELESVTHSGGMEEAGTSARSALPSSPSMGAVPRIEQPAARGKSTLVSLRLDIATYFRRPGTPDDSTP
jgi:hypothetical protein